MGGDKEKLVISKEELREMGQYRSKLAFLKGWLSQAISDDRSADQLRASIRAALEGVEQ